MEQDFLGFVRDLDSFALIVSGKNFRTISGYSSNKLIAKKFGNAGYEDYM